MYYTYINYSSRYILHIHALVTPLLAHTFGVNFFGKIIQVNRTIKINFKTPTITTTIYSLHNGLLKNGLMRP